MGPHTLPAHSPIRPLVLLSPLRKALPLLQAKFPIERARMRLKLTAPSDRKEQLLEMVDSYDAVVESVDQAGANTSVVAQVGGGVERGRRGGWRRIGLR